MHGGVSAIEYSPAGIARRALPVDADDLNDRFVLAYTGAPRNSGINNWEVMKGHIDGDRRIQRNFDRIASIANAMRDAVARDNWDEAGRLMRRVDEPPEKRSPAFRTPAIDRLVAATRRAGSPGAYGLRGPGRRMRVFLVAPRSESRRGATYREAGARVLPAKVARGASCVTGLRFADEGALSAGTRSHPSHRRRGALHVPVLRHSCSW